MRITKQLNFEGVAIMNRNTADNGRHQGHGHSHDAGRSHGQGRFDDRPVPAISDDLNEDRLRGRLEESRAWERRGGPEGAEAALAYIRTELESRGLPVTIHECDVYVPPSDPDAPGDWRRIRFPMTNIVPDGGTALFVLAGGRGDASFLVEMARLLHRHRNELSHGVRVAWWNGGGEVGFGPAEWYADSHFDLLRSRCLAYFNVDPLGGRSCSGYEPYATAELADWGRSMVERAGGHEAEPAPLPRDADGGFLGVGLPCISFLPPSMAQGPDEMNQNDLVERTGFYANALFDLCAHPRAPLDMMTVADVLWGELQVLQKEVGGAFDFGEAGEAVKELVVVLEDREEEHAEMEAGDLNRKMLNMCHLLNPALYTENGPFGRDAGGNRGVLPGPRRSLALNRLDPESGEWKALRARLVQERNRLCAAISRAILVGRG
jgi:hypothetical protein